MRIEVLACGEYYAALGAAREAVTHEDLRPLLADVCRERFRRIDRFTQLALLGSARCVQGRELPANTGLYISSGFGSIANTINVQQQIFVEYRVPKPLNFINTLSNSAGYYVARNLGLQARNQFVGRDVAPLEAALQLAMLDLELGNVEQALVGVVDEVSLPLDEHARRLGVDADVVLAEGSHWFLLAAAANSASTILLDEVCLLTDAGDLKNWFVACEPVADAKIWFASATKTEAELRNACSWFDLHPSALGAYPSKTGGAVMQFLNGTDGSELVTVAPDEGRFHVMRFVRTA